MKTSDLKEGQVFNHRIKGIGRIVRVTPRTVTASYDIVTTKITLRSKDTDFSFNDL